MAAQHESRQELKKRQRFLLLTETAKINKLFQDSILLDGENLVERDVDPEEAKPDEKGNTSTTLGSKTCALCDQIFQDLVEQRQHFKLDWHRMNVKRKLAGNPVLSEQEFDDLLARKSESLDDDLESISGSESEDEDQETVNNSNRQKLYLVNAAGNVFSIHKCLVPAHESVGQWHHIPQRLNWAILMLGGGHFAGAVFDGDKAVLHKTFHCYTVRAKQGGGQSSADNRSGTNHPKSAGASLRRYNEASLSTHISEILKLWAESLAKCHLIFYRAASGNKKLLFNAQGAKEKSILDKKDNRVRTIPFPTRRATFKEVKRVREVLSTVELHGSRAEFQASCKSVKSMRSNTTSPQKSRIRRSKSRELPDRKMPEIIESLAQEAREDEGDEVGDLAREVQDHHLDNLVEFEIKIDDIDELDNDLVTSCLAGNKKLLLETILLIQDDKKRNLSSFLNRGFGSSKSSPLHLAAKNNQNGIVACLLEHGSNPTLRDKLKKTPYQVAGRKETRNVFRRFQAQNLSAFDWQDAQVPTADLLTPEEEARQAAKKKEKRKAQKLVKKEKDFEERKIKQEKQKEEAEKLNFLKLSDREKRALAAERRLLSKESSHVASQRCFKCAKDITGKVPFEYSSNRFCSPLCVREHRKTNS